MKTIKVVKSGVEYELTLQSHTEIAEQIQGRYDGYKLECIESDNAIKIYEKSNHYFNKFKTKIGKLYFDINTDTVFYSQYGFARVENSIGIYKAVLKNLRENDIIILKGKTSSKVEYRKQAGIILSNIKNFAYDNKFIYVPMEFLRKWK